MSERRKTTILLPHELHRQIETCGRRIGISQNGFLAMGSAFLIAELSKIDSRQKRLKMLKDLDSSFQRILSEARKAA